jgi:hypothetical protein
MRLGIHPLGKAKEVLEFFPHNQPHGGAFGKGRGNANKCKQCAGKYSRY